MLSFHQKRKFHLKQEMIFEQLILDHKRARRKLEREECPHENEMGESAIFEGKFCGICGLKVSFDE